ncbi:hypothetical protein SAMN05660297_02482 [Natronincola peptidivorans]|uniref:Uncharacterized protein n=1 Tax=Natronincola peptidivorans TaxID=426128 RepID=A0A1I0EMD3_9FIRM|nr:hypothetical protein [Natronincola peptidivorans]SET46381.1 hypothetical protein SAMN05660297_02482 [Natronincola peptidivorans]
MNKRIKEAQEALEQAWQNFNYAEEAYRDTAIVQVNQCMKDLAKLLEAEGKTKSRIAREGGDENEGLISIGRQPKGAKG